MNGAASGSGRPPDIVVVTHFFPSHGGGIELVAARLVDQYLEAGLAVDWFASATDAPPPEKPGLRLHAVPALNVIERLTQLPYPIWAPSAAISLWRSIGRAQAVHVHEHLYVGSLLAILIGRMRHKRVVLTQHMGALSLPARWATVLYTAGAKVLAIPAMRLASRVAFISANVMAFFDRVGARPAHRMLLFNGLDSDTFAFADEGARADARRRLGIQTQQPVAIFAGRFVRKKGLPLLRELAAGMPDVAWLFVGSGPDDPQSWGLPNVHCLGQLSQRDLSQALAAADVLVLPSFGEGFPLVVQEALACGTCVLSTHEVANACPDAYEMVQTVPLEDEATDASRWEAALRTSIATSANELARQQRATWARCLWSWEDCSTRYLELLGVISDHGKVQRPTHSTAPRAG